MRLVRTALMFAILLAPVFLLVPTPRARLIVLATIGTLFLAGILVARHGPRV